MEMYSVSVESSLELNWRCSQSLLNQALSSTGDVVYLCLIMPRAQLEM